MASFLDLPDDVLFLICVMAPIPAVACLRGVSHEMKERIHTPVLWQDMFLTHWGARLSEHLYDPYTAFTKIYREAKLWRNGANAQRVEMSQTSTDGIVQNVRITNGVTYVLSTCPLPFSKALDLQISTFDQEGRRLEETVLKPQFGRGQVAGGLDACGNTLGICVNDDLFLADAQTLCTTQHRAGFANRLTALHFGTDHAMWVSGHAKMGHRYPFLACYDPRVGLAKEVLDLASKLTTSVTAMDATPQYVAFAEGDPQAVTTGYVGIYDVRAMHSPIVQLTDVLLPSCVSLQGDRVCYASQSSPVIKVWNIKNQIMDTVIPDGVLQTAGTVPIRCGIRTVHLSSMSLVSTCTRKGLSMFRTDGTQILQQKIAHVQTTCIAVTANRIWIGGVKRGLRMVQPKIPQSTVVAST